MLAQPCFHLVQALVDPPLHFPLEDLDLALVDPPPYSHRALAPADPPLFFPLEGLVLAPVDPPPCSHLVLDLADPPLSFPLGDLALGHPSPQEDLPQEELPTSVPTALSRSALREMDALLKASKCVPSTVCRRCSPRCLP